MRLQLSMVRTRRLPDRLLLGAATAWTQRPQRRRVEAACQQRGHYRGSLKIERDLRYVPQLADGSQVTLTPAEFAQRFGWKNDPEKVRLVGK